MTAFKDAVWGHVNYGMFEGIIATQHIVNGKGLTSEFSYTLSDPYFGQFLSARQLAPLHACYRAGLVSVREDVPSVANRQPLVATGIPLAFLYR